MIANAVPSPADTSAPVLQWVRTRARSGIRPSPCAAMAALAAASSAAIDPGLGQGSRGRRSFGIRGLVPPRWAA